MISRHFFKGDFTFQKKEVTGEDLDRLIVLEEEKPILILSLGTKGGGRTHYLSGGSYYLSEVKEIYVEMKLLCRNSKK